MRNISTIFAIAVLLFASKLSFAQDADDVKTARTVIFDHIKTLDEQVFNDLLKKFDACSTNAPNAIENLWAFVQPSNTKWSLINATSKQITYHLNGKSYATFLTQEVNDYVQSLDLVKKEAESLNSKIDCKLNAFNNLRFISAYNNMKVARALLKMTIDNLQENLTLGKSVKDIAVQTNAIAVQTNTICFDISAIKQATLENPIIINKNTDKKTRTWGLIGGLLGGLVGGVIAGLIIK